MSIRILLTKDFEQMSEVASIHVESRLVELQQVKDEVVLGLATGNSPTGLYSRLAEAANAGRVDSARWRTFNLDEYLGLENESSGRPHRESYARFMDQSLFGLLKTRPLSVTLPPADQVDPRKLRQHMEKYPADWEAVGSGSGRAIVVSSMPESHYLQWIRSEVLAPFPMRVAATGGVDVQVLGVGRGGHVAFHEAGISFALKGLLLVELDSHTKQDAVRDGHFPSLDECPQFALTMSVDLVFRARSVLVLASGSRKEKAIRESILGTPSEEMPMSYVQVYSDRGGEVIFVVDETAAAGILGKEEDLSKRGFELLDLRHR